MSDSIGKSAVVGRIGAGAAAGIAVVALCRVYRRQKEVRAADYATGST